MADLELEVSDRKWIPGYEPIQGSAMHPRRKAALVGLVALAVVCVIGFGGHAIYRAEATPVATQDAAVQSGAADGKLRTAPVAQPSAGSSQASGASPAAVSSGNLLSGLKSAAVCTNTLQSGTITLPTGSKRSFELYVDTNFDTSRLHPIVFIWHGLDGTVEKMEDAAKFRQEADAMDWILVYPTSVGSWPYAGFTGKGCCDKNGADDMAYAKEIITYLETTMCADPHKVYTTGFSNGGFMTHKMACDAGLRADGFPWIAAAAPHSGLIGEYSGTLPAAASYTGCKPPAPVPIMAFHGTADGTVPFNGNNPNPFSTAKWYGFEDTKTIWKAANGCGDEQPLLQQHTSTSTCEVYAGCKVSWCTITSLKHEWAVAPSHVDATDQIIAFFKSL